VVAVVGSLGKTTTAQAIRTVLGKLSTGSGFGNRGFYIARSLLSAHPFSHYAVVETGIEQPGEMARQAAMLRPDLTVVTSVASDHNRSLANLTVTRWEKARMVAATAPRGLVVLNGDNPNVLWMRGEAVCPVVTYGFEPHNDFRARDYHLCWPEGSTFRLESDTDEPLEIFTPLVGRHMVYPALAALTVAHHAEIPLAKAVQQLRSLRPLPMRLEPVPLPQGAWLLRDEYKSGLETIEVALDLLAEIPARRRFVVLGEVTEPPLSSGEIYRRLGRRLAEVADQAIILSHLFQRYRAGARRAGHRVDHWVDAHTDVLQALSALPLDLGPGDVILVKGRQCQRMQRISLALLGRKVGCRIPSCHAPVDCASCPRLEPGWAARPALLDSR
jgi:UDP-N-acetylmuramyl pentapeptide synthase